MNAGARVTVVIPTYNRPDAIRTAIHSVRAQDFDAWRLLVIGDQCDHRTEDSVTAFADDRITYLNLPIRCGEQSGPNSVGIAAVDSEYIALLNHDDAYLQDHLTYGIDVLEKTKADFFLGCSACAFRSESDPAGGWYPVFSALRPVNRSIANVVWDAELFEPCSAWIVRTEMARKVGYWKRAVDLHRTPLQQWLMQAWRAGARFVFGETATVFMMRTHRQQRFAVSGGSYSQESDEHRYLANLIDRLSAEQIRASIQDTLQSGGDPFAAVKRSVANRVLNAVASRLYYHTGFDLISGYRGARGYDKKERHKKLLAKRTNEELPEYVPIDSIVESALPLLATSRTPVSTTANQ